MDASYKGGGFMAAALFFLSVQDWIVLPDVFFHRLTGFFSAINEIRKVINCFYDFFSSEKRICCDLLRSGSARAASATQSIKIRIAYSNRPLDGDIILNLT